jgi:transposase
MRVLYDRVAAIDVHKDMVKVAIRVPGAKRGTRKTDVLEFRTFYGVLQAMARELRGRGVTHVVMEASGVYTDPVYYALRELDFTEVMVINPAHAKALKGHKTDAKDAIRLLDLYECGLLSGSYIPDPDLREVRDLARYRMKTVQARTSEIQRLQKTLERSRDQVVLGRVRCYRGLGDGDDRGADQRGTPRQRDGGPGADPDAHRREDGRPVDGPDRPVH